MMFYDGTLRSDVVFENIILDIIGGGFYSNLHFYSSNIDIYNFSVQTNQLNVDDTKGILNFELVDFVTISKMAVLYL